MRPALFALLVVACSSPAATQDDAATTGSDADSGPIGGDRPVVVHVPPSYTAGTPTPLVIMLHGYSATAALEESYLQLTPLADARGFLYATPDGKVDTNNNHYWNATDACCDFGGTMVDDSTYLSTLVTQIAAHYTVDPKRVYFMGHSNGGFMSYRMACDHADQIAAIASLAGAMWNDPARCPAASPVSVLQIHGDADGTVSYTGGTFGAAYPSAATTVGDWATFDGCNATADTSAPPRDLDSGLAGDETTVTTYAAGCSPGGHVELWAIHGGGHIPSLSTTFSAQMIDFLLAHPKP